MKIEDEHDDPGLVEKQMGDGEFIFSGRLEVEYINGKYHLDIPESDEYDTLAGYVIDRYQGIPSAGETILDGGPQDSRAAHRVVENRAAAYHAGRDFVPKERSGLNF